MKLQKMDPKSHSILAVLQSIASGLIALLSVISTKFNLIVTCIIIMIIIIIIIVSLLFQQYYSSQGNDQLATSASKNFADFKDELKEKSILLCSEESKLQDAPPPNFIPNVDSSHISLLYFDTYVNDKYAVYALDPRRSNTLKIIHPILILGPDNFKKFSIRECPIGLQFVVWRSKIFIFGGATTDFSTYDEIKEEDVSPAGSGGKGWSTNTLVCDMEKNNELEIKEGLRMNAAKLDPYVVLVDDKAYVFRNCILQDQKWGPNFEVLNLSDESCSRLPEPFKLDYFDYSGIAIEAYCIFNKKLYISTIKGIYQIDLSNPDGQWQPLEAYGGLQRFPFENKGIFADNLCLTNRSAFDFTAPNGLAEPLPYLYAGSHFSFPLNCHLIPLTSRQIAVATIHREKEYGSSSFVDDIAISNILLDVYALGKREKDPNNVLCVELTKLRSYKYSYYHDDDEVPKLNGCFQSFSFFFLFFLQLGIH